MSRLGTVNFGLQLSEVSTLLNSYPSGAAEALRRICQGSLKSEQILPLAEVVGKVSAVMPRDSQIRISVLGEPTTSAIAAAISVAAMGEGLIPDVRASLYGSVRQEILDPDSELYEFAPNIVLIVPNPVIENVEVDATAARSFVEQQANGWIELWRILTDRLPSVRVLHHLYEKPDAAPAGIGEQRVPWSAVSVTHSINEHLISSAPKSVHFLDMESLAADVGYLNWRDQRLWLYGKVPFSPRHLAAYTVRLSAALRRVTGRIYKALVLDLDNTLWGGVVGDDGLDGIRLGPGEALGEAYSQMVAYVKQLGRRGVILGVCSKNDRAIAEKVFLEHPFMPLDLEDFAVFKCNWQDKATNLHEIIAQLNVDPSAIVFVDDNPFECELVRRELPTVRVVELSGDPANIVRNLDQLKLFEVDGFSSEDLGRTASYRARKFADNYRTSTSSMEEYLGGLQMQGAFWQARQSDVPRLAQMESKTNQFNLTTRRFSGEQLAKFISEGDASVYCFSLADRFANHGLVGSMVVSYRGSEAHILSWLLSCRVFSRGCEYFMFKRLCREIEMNGARILVGRYQPTEKNKVVADLYSRLEFKENAEGSFELDVSCQPNKACFIEVVDSSNVHAALPAI